ncbi:MAG: flagellar hook assembly protein FlgD [Alphaproteobacteria bacterium]
MDVTQALGPGTAIGSGDARRSLGENFDTFLTLLTTQLANQDPLSPMDSTEFTNQVVQFSALEQQINQSQNLAALIALMSSSQALAATGYIGKTVEAESPVAILENGKATIPYSMPPGAESATITIFDDGGNVVGSFDAGSRLGRNEFIWNGKNSQGVPQPDGVYSVLLGAKDADGRPVDGGKVFFTGRVTEVARDDGTVLLKVGDIGVELERVAAVRIDM